MITKYVSFLSFFPALPPYWKKVEEPLKQKEKKKMWHLKDTSSRLIISLQVLMLNPSNFMPVPKYLKRKEGGSQGCLETGKINDLGRRRLSKKVLFQWKRFEHHGRLRTDTTSLLVPWDAQRWPVLHCVQPHNLSFATHMFVFINLSFAFQWKYSGGNDATCSQELVGHCGMKCEAC